MLLINLAVAVVEIKLSDKLATIFIQFADTIEYGCCL